MELAREEAVEKASAEVKKKIQEQMELEAEAQEAAASTQGTGENSVSNTTCPQWKYKSVSVQD